MDMLIRAVPPEVHAALTVRAKARQMSLRGYALNLLIEAVSVPSDAEPTAMGPAVLERLDRLTAQVSALADAVTEGRQSLPAPSPVVVGPAARNVSPEPAKVSSRTTKAVAAAGEVEVLPGPPAPSPEPVAPVVGDEAAPIDPFPADPDPELAEDLFGSAPAPEPGAVKPPAPPVPMEASVVPDVRKPLSVVERWVAEGTGRARLATLDRWRVMSGAELDLYLARSGKSREQFAAAVGRMLDEWLEGEGEPRPADPTEAVAALAAELKAALARAEAVQGS